MNVKNKRSESHQIRVIELRRSNAAMPHANKARYSRKVKYSKDIFND